MQERHIFCVVCAIFGQAILAAPTRTNPEQQPAEASASDERGQLLNRMIRMYSEQQVFCLDIGEEYSFKRKDGSERLIRLISVKEHRDNVIRRMRRAEIGVGINGVPLHLTCAPYVMPIEINGIRIQADTTSGWGNIPKSVQFSIWDSTDPIVNVDRFSFPISNYALFSHSMQCYNEVVHLGRNDGDPQGPNFYHDYGIDLAGYEGREEIISCTDGEVIRVSPSPQKACCVIVQDEKGLFWEYCHLDSVVPGIEKGARLKRGQKIGILGKTGGSGNFSHLHLGDYLSRADVRAKTRNRRLNLYPWIVAAYQKQHPGHLYAVARPHQTISAGEKALFDGSNSLAFGATIVSYKWVFHDGETVDTPKTEKRFDTPGVYIASLWVEDEKGTKDVDFCRIKVFTKSAPEDRIPTIFMTHTPTRDVLVDQPVHFRSWLQGWPKDLESVPFAIDFGDGTTVDGYTSYSEIDHRFGTAGIHIVTAQATIGNKPIMQKQKVVVGGHVSKQQTNSEVKP
jgi:murein DD-endopeptidase MepM/ murein hydrolase activator NlpD